MRVLTRRRVSAGLAVVLSTGVLAIGSHALAASADTTVQPVVFGAETWYQPDPTCSLLTGCVSVGISPPAINPYGAGTLHVSVASDAETSRTYLALPQVVAPSGATLTSAMFTAPLDTSNVASLAPDTSTLHVCSATGTITADEGEFDSPPATTLCSGDVDLTYVATPTPELTGDLAPLLNAHLSDLASGKLDLALLPLIASSTAAWHDVFDSNDGSAKATTPTLNLTFTSGDGSAPVNAVDTPTDSPSPTDSATPAATASAATPVTPTKPLPVTSAAAPVAAAPVAPLAAALPPTTVVPAPAAAVASSVPKPQLATSEAAVTQQAPVSAPVETVASTRTVGFAYPAILLLPLVLIAGGAGLARVMTRDVTPKSARHQG